MAIRKLLIIFAATTLVCSIETDDIEYKKRGAGKTTGVNTIPTGIQKPEYTYSIYSQNPNTVQQSSVPSQSYQDSNSFYPSQASSQYYSSSSSNNEESHSNNPQVNVPQQQTASQYVPLNFIPNSGYQSKYQIVPSKSPNGNIQLAIIRPSTGFPTHNVQVPQTVYSQPTNQVNPNPLLTSVSPHGQFNFHPSYQPLSLASPYLGHAPTVLFPQFNHPFYNNLLYPTPSQSFFYPSNSEAKNSYSQISQATISNGHANVDGSGSVSSASAKEDNDIAVQSSELIHGESIPGYKNPYTSSRSATYTKIK